MPIYTFINVTTYPVVYNFGNLRLINTCNNALQNIICRESPDTVVESRLIAWQANIRVFRPSLAPRDLRCTLIGNPGVPIICENNERLGLRYTKEYKEGNTRISTTVQNPSPSHLLLSS